MLWIIVGHFETVSTPTHVQNFTALFLPSKSIAKMRWTVNWLTMRQHWIAGGVAALCLLTFAVFSRQEYRTEDGHRVGSELGNIVKIISNLYSVNGGNFDGGFPRSSPPRTRQIIQPFYNTEKAETLTLKRRQGPKSGPGRSRDRRSITPVELTIQNPASVSSPALAANPSPGPRLTLNIKKFLSKHLKSPKSFPSDDAGATRLVTQLRNEVGELMYSRRQQTVMFPTSEAQLIDTITAESANIWKTDTPQLSKIANDPYHGAVAELNKAAPDYPKIVKFLVDNGTPATLENIQAIDKLQIRKLLDRAVGTVIFELPSPILLTPKDTGPMMFIERQGDDPTSSKNKKNNPPQPVPNSNPNPIPAKTVQVPNSNPTPVQSPVPSWGLSEINTVQGVKVNLYLEVAVNDGELISDIARRDIKKEKGEWQVHFASDTTPDSLKGAQKIFDFQVTPAFTEIDRLNRERRLQNSALNQKVTNVKTALDEHLGSANHQKLTTDLKAKFQSELTRHEQEFQAEQIKVDQNPDISAKRADMRRLLQEYQKSLEDLRVAREDLDALNKQSLIQTDKDTAKNKIDKLKQASAEAKQNLEHVKKEIADFEKNDKTFKQRKEKNTKIKDIKADMEKSKVTIDLLDDASDPVLQNRRELIGLEKDRLNDLESLIEKQAKEIQTRLTSVDLDSPEWTRKDSAAPSGGGKKKGGKMGTPVKPTTKIDLVKNTINQERNILKIQEKLVLAQGEYLKGAQAKIPSKQLDNLQDNMLFAKSELDKAKKEYNKEQTAGQIVDLDDLYEARVEAFTKATSCSGGSGGTGRKKRSAGSCLLHQKRESQIMSVELGEQKLKRKGEKRQRFKEALKGLFSKDSGSNPDQGQKVNPKGHKNTDPSLEKVVKSKNLKGRFRGSNFVQGFLGLREVEQAYVGRKTVQKGLANNKRTRVGSRLAKVGGALDKANYAFLFRDFSKAVITGDVTTMAIMGSMTGVQVGSSVLGKIATKSKVLGMTVKVGKSSAKAMMVASRLAGAGLSVVGSAFDLLSIVNSGQCLASRSKNKDLCRRRNSGCTTENEICEGRDAVADIVTGSLSLIGTGVSLAFPPAAPFVAIFTVVMVISSEVYQATKYVNNFEKDIPLSAHERAIQISRRLLGQEISGYLRDLKKQKEVNTRALEHMRAFLEENSDTFFAFFAPALDKNGVALLDNVVRVRDQDWMHQQYSRWSPDPDRKVDGVKIYDLDKVDFFCGPTMELPSNLFHRPPETKRRRRYLPLRRPRTAATPQTNFLQGFSYYCLNTMGVRLKRKNLKKPDKDLFALFRLERGTDSVAGFENKPNFFQVQSGRKDFAGGLLNDVFVIEEAFTGVLRGGGGHNYLQLSDSLSSSSTVEVLDGSNEAWGSAQTLRIEGKKATLFDIQQIRGRARWKDVIYATCNTTNIDGGGGSDQIIVQQKLSCPSPMELQIEARPKVNIQNSFKGQGQFLYRIQNNAGESGKIRIEITTQAPSQSSRTSTEHHVILESRASATKFSWILGDTRDEIQIRDPPTSITLPGTPLSYGISLKTADNTHFFFYRDQSSNFVQLDAPARNLSVHISKEAGKNLNILNIQSIHRHQSSLKFELEIRLPGKLGTGQQDGSKVNIGRTKDGAMLMLMESQSKASDITPLFYFSLANLKPPENDEGSSTLSIEGSEGAQNYFEISRGNVAEGKQKKMLNVPQVMGGKNDDHFLLDFLPPELQLLSSGDGGSDAIELGPGLEPYETIKINPVDKRLEFLRLNSQLTYKSVRLQGDFEEFVGRSDTHLRDELQVPCSTTRVDLRGGPDFVMIPDRSTPCSRSMKMVVQVRPGLIVENRYRFPGQFSYIVHPPNDRDLLTSVAHYPIKFHFLTPSKSVENFIEFQNLTAAQVQHIHVLHIDMYLTFGHSEPGLHVKLDNFFELFLRTTDQHDNFPTIVTADHAVLAVVSDRKEQGGRGPNLRPAFYFDLSSKTKKKTGSVRGNPNYSNYMKLSGQRFDIISGGKLDDRFILGRGFGCNFIDGGGGGGVDILELDDQLGGTFAEQMNLDFYSGTLWSASNEGAKCQMVGHTFRHILGREGIPESLTASPSLLSIDLKGGQSTIFPDHVFIPNFTIPMNLTLALRHHTRVVAEPCSGKITYHFQPGSGRSKVTIKVNKNIKVKDDDPSKNSNSLLQTFYLDFPARYLKLSLEKSPPNLLRLLIQAVTAAGGETDDQLELELVTSFDVWNVFDTSLQIVTKDQARVIFIPPSQAHLGQLAFKFILAGSVSDELPNVYGGRFNLNFFVIGGRYGAVVGGYHDDKFIIGAESQVALIDCGSRIGCSLEFDEKIVGQVEINLFHGFYKFSQARKSTVTEIRGRFGHIQGRRSGSDVVSLSPALKTMAVNLRGVDREEGGEEGDFILIPESSRHATKEIYDVDINLLLDSSPLSLWNGANRGRFNYQIENPRGKINLFNVYNVQDGETKEVVKETFFLSTIPFHKIRNLEVNPEKTTITLTYTSNGGDTDVEEHAVSFHITHFPSYRHLFESFNLAQQSYRKARDSDPAVETKILPNVDDSEGATTNHPNFAEQAFPESLENDPDDRLQPLNPPIKFPTLTTADNYEFVINHLGGIHAVTSISRQDFTDDENLTTEEVAAEVVAAHVQLANDLGIALIISLVADNGERGETHMIFIGGDDETDVLMNHPLLPSHLVGNAGGDQNIFAVFPTQNQSPVYIYIPSVDLDHNLDLDPDSDLTSSYQLNLAGFFDRPISFSQNPDGEDEQETTTIRVEETEEEASTQDSNNVSTPGPDQVKTPKILVPKIMPEVNGDDLRILVRYLADPYCEEEEDCEELTQEVVFVGGVHSFRKLSILLYVATYRIERKLSKDGGWHLVPDNLILSTGQQEVQNTGETVAETPTNQLTHAFLSYEDLVEYLTFGIPIQLDSHTQPLILTKDSFYRNEDSLIITNQVESNPSLDWAGIWAADSTPSSIQPRTMSIVLLDIKESMEREKIRLVLKDPEPEKRVGDDLADDPFNNFVLSFDQFNDLAELEEAIEEMNRKRGRNQNIVLAFWILFLVFGVVFVLVIARCALRKVGGTQCMPLFLNRVHGAYVKVAGRKKKKKPTKTLQKVRENCTNEPAALTLLPKSVCDLKAHEEVSDSDTDADDGDNEDKCRNPWIKRSLLPCQVYWMENHRVAHWQEVKRRGQCFCQRSTVWNF